MRRSLLAWSLRIQWCALYFFSSVVSKYPLVGETDYRKIDCNFYWHWYHIPFIANTHSGNLRFWWVTGDTILPLSTLQSHSKPSPLSTHETREMKVKVLVEEQRGKCRIDWYTWDSRLVPGVPRLFCQCKGETFHSLLKEGAVPSLWQYVFHLPLLSRCLNSAVGTGVSLANKMLACDRMWQPECDLWHSYQIVKCGGMNLWC